MGAINLENIRPGMVLARDTKDPNGRVLLVSGTELTEKHLRVLKIWGVSEAEIQGIDQEDVVAQAASQVDPVSLKNAEASAAKLFAYSDKSHPAVAELKRLTVQRFLRAASKGGSPE
jgi:hypothetical protein